MIKLNIEGFLNQIKANKTLDNVTAAAADNLNAVGARTVVETYKNGFNWYRVFSDGFIEQGGRISNNSTLTFLKAFSNTDYTVLTEALSTNTPLTICELVNRTTTKTNVVASYTGGYSWVAFGY